MNKSEKYQLNLPEGSDPYDVEHMNANTRIIEQKLKENEEHNANKNNPHVVTKTQVGLGNVDNTSDVNKPISTAQKQAIDNATVSGTATGTNPTIQDNTNAPLIYGKFKGYTLQNGEPTPDNPVEINGLAKDGTIGVKTTGKNIFGGSALTLKLMETFKGTTISEDGQVQFIGSNRVDNNVLFDKFKENTQYTIILYGKGSTNLKSSNMCIQYTDGTKTIIYFNETNYAYTVYVSDIGKTIKNVYGIYQEGITTLYYEKCGVFEGVITLEDFEPYKETTAAIPTDAPLYEGDYLEIFADGSGKVVRKMAKVVFDGSDDEELKVEFSTTTNSYYVYLMRSVATLGIKKSCTNIFSTHYKSAGKIGNYKHNIYTKDDGTLIIREERFATVGEYKAWLQSNPVTVVYELAEPTEIELTAEQVAEFKKLCTFEPITNVLCDGEVEMRYYKANVNGETVGMLQGMVEKSNETVGMLQEQTKDFAKKSIYGDTTINVGRKEGSFVGDCSTAEGYNTTASGYASHSQGDNTTASGLTSHSQGYNTTASGDYAHSEGNNTTASGKASHSEGTITTASGYASHSEGNNTIASGQAQHVQGKYNVEDTEDKYAHIVGGGTYKERKNIHTLDWDGNAEFAGNVLGHDVNGNSVSLSNITRYLGRIDLGMSAIQNTYDFTSFAGYDRYTLVFKGKDANRSLFTRELLTIHNIEKNTSNVGKVCLDISNNYTFEPWVEMYQSSGDKTYIVVQVTNTIGLTTLISGLYVEVYGAMN